MLLIATLASAACSPSVDVVQPSAVPIVEAIDAAPEPQRWAFSYQAISASPYISCLNGIDQVAGVIDLTSGLVLVEPNRVAPPILVTESAILVETDPDTGYWTETPWSAASESSRLVEVFGEIAAGYVSTGLRAPDPNMTSLAFITIADRVDVAETRPGLDGRTIEITVNGDRYLDELVNGRNAVVTGDDLPIPRVRVTVDSNGRVTALEVRVEGKADEVHGDGYVTTFQYPEGRLELPEAELVERVEFPSLSYPRPASSCRFQS